MKTGNRIVVCGDTQCDAARWTALALEFNFDLEFIPEISGLGQVPNCEGISSVVVHLDQHGATAAELSTQVRRYAPQARLIISKPMASGISVGDLRAAGVFHSLRQPIQSSEMRQSLGFLWSALRQDAGNAQLAIEQAAEKNEASLAAADSEPAADSPASTNAANPGLTPDLSTSR
jgi:hypothetical protein